MLNPLKEHQTSRKQCNAIRDSRFDRRAGLHSNGIPWPVPRVQRDVR